MDQLTREQAAVLAEREACAQIAKSFAEANRRKIEKGGLKNRDRTRVGAKVSAFESMENAIRARSNESLKPPRLAETQDMITPRELSKVFGERVPMRFVDMMMADDCFDGPLDLRQAVNRALDEEGR